MSQKRSVLFRGRHFEDVIIILCVRWYLRYSLSYRDLEEMTAERGLSVDHVTIWRWLQHLIYSEYRRSFTAVRPCLQQIRGDGDGPTVTSVPGGYYSPRVGESAAKAGIQVLFNSEPTATVRSAGNCVVLGRMPCGAVWHRRFQPALPRGTRSPASDRRHCGSSRRR